MKRAGKEKWGGGNSVLTAAGTRDGGFFEGLRTGRNRSTRSGGEAAAVPTPGRQVFGQFNIGCKQYHGAGGFTAFGAAASDMSDAAFGSMVETEVEGLISDAKKDFNVEFYGTELGVLARVNGDPGVGTAVTVDQLQALVAWDASGTRYLSAGLELDFIAEADGTVRAGAPEVTSVTDRVTFELVAAANAAVADNDLIVRRGSVTQAGGAAVPTAFTGLEQLIDDLTTMPAAGVSGNYDLDILQGLDRNTAGNAFARGQVLDLANADLSENALQNLVYRAEENSATYPDLILTHRSVQSAIQRLMVGDRRFQPQKFAGGFQADALLMNFGDHDVKIIVDRECPYDRAYLLNMDSFRLYVLRDIELMEETGSILRQAADGSDSWVFSFRLFANLGSVQPNALGKIVRIGGADERFGVGGNALVVTTF